MTDRTLANVLGDTLAHHEADPALESLVLADPIYHAVAGETQVARAWLDYERAGRVAAEALLEISHADAQHAVGPLFVLRQTPATAIVGSGAETATTRHGSAVADSGHLSPPPDSGARNLIGRMMGLARQVMPVEPQRHRFLVNQMRNCGLDTPTLGSLHQLDEGQLLGIIEKLEIYGQATHRLVTPGAPA